MAVQIVFLLTVLLVAAVDGRARPSTCLVSDWTPWVERPQPYHDPTQTSLPSPQPTRDPDPGTIARLGMMERKTRQAEERRACLEAGTCPELVKRNDEGAFPCVEGFINGRLPCLNVNQRAFVSMESLGAGANDAGNDIWGWTDPQTGDEYAIMGVERGTSFVRVTDPENPLVLCFVYTHTSFSTWRDIKVVNDHAYIVSEASGHGIQVFDLTRLRTMTEPQGQVPPDAHYDELGNCHNIVGSQDHQTVYAVGCTSSPNGCSGGLHAVNVANPKEPRFSGCFSDDGYVHDAQCVNYQGPDPDYQGKHICFCYNENTLTIVDATASSFMSMISRIGYGAHYTHQGWVTEDHTMLLLDDELDEVEGNSRQKTYIWDINDLDNPALVNTYNSGLDSIDHNQYILGDLTYQANYMSGLRILHINQPTATLSEVAYIDIYPSSNDVDFRGAWSVYPYFSSGNLIISSIDYGLYIVTPDMAAIREAIDSEQTATAERTRFRAIIEGASTDDCPALTQTETL